MSEFTLNAQARNDLGKGASRRLRRNANLIPAVVYGAGKEPASISLETREVAKLLLNDAAYSSILSLNIDGKKENVLIKALQRHPAKSFVLHADFIRVVAGQKLTTLVPVLLLNEDTCVGAKTGGGDIFRLATELEITCLPKDLPDAIEVDMANINVGEIVHLADLTAPKGVEFTALAHDNNIAVASVQAARVNVEVDEDQDQPAEAAEGEAEEK
ncbi:MAG: 50S ribosomal protein L25/general stress protein Ctc [Thiopseudomonas sp.]|jgi:large subunit ribosomal protein L25|nr:50S ribosomal protein L25/general stress protein Ctc [Thiopseudomonas sp.]MBP9614768.1 50S ribosomal protein L25/general stress protein Ctc [Thiopseudomonas sp.]